MFTNPYREKCVNILEKLLPRRAVQDSTLLQAYATFHMMKEVTLSGANYAEIYRAASRKSAPYLYALLADFAALKMPFPEDFVLMFDVQLDYFLRCVTPSLVADLRSFHRFFEEYGAPNLAAKVHYLVVLKLTSFKILEADEARAREKARTRSAKSEQEIPSSSGELFRGDLTDDALDRLYQVYCNIETNVAIRLNKEKFSALYRAINLYPLDNSELKIYAPNSKNVMELLNILSEKLEEPRSRQLSFAADFYVRNLQEGALFATYGMPLFGRNRDERERKKLLRKAVLLMAGTSPMNVLCGISLSKKASDGKLLSAAPGDSPTIIRNDVTLENGLIYSLLTSAFLGNLSAETEAIIFFPTPFFVRKWIADSALAKKKVTFVMGDSMSAELLNFCISEGTYTEKRNEKLSFICYETWLKSMEGDKEFLWKEAVLFAAGRSLEEQNAWYATIKKTANSPVEIHALISSKEFENARSPFASELADPRIQLRSLALIPQGINNSTQPRRKLFLNASFDPDIPSDEKKEPQKTRLYAFTLNTDFKVQALSQRHLLPQNGGFLSIEQGKLAELDQSVRQLFQAELLERRAAGRQKNVAISYEFTPDITIWCSKSYPKKDGYPRLEAYICKPPPRGKVQRGYLERGAQIPETIKRTTSFTGRDICEWLEKTYPFSYRYERNYYRDERAKLADEGNPSERLLAKPAKPRVSIRETIIEKTAAQFEKTNLALKTLWYIYPCLEDLMSGRDYKLLSEMMLTELGQNYVADMTEDACITQIEDLYPEESQAQLRRRCQILYTVFELARKQGHCRENPLQQMVTDEQHSNKMFAKIRGSLAVRSLTKEELTDVFQTITAKLEAGETAYLGVLIRLLTGLESNIVCALKWGDFEEIADYGIYRLVVAHQVTNDGETVRGFDSLEDYRLLPCCKLLAAYLLQQKRATQESLASHYGGSIRNFPIVTASGEKARWQDYEVMLAPKELERVSREILSAAKLDAHMVTIPDYQKGSKETNLSHYQGDFFRENFKYWAQELCKFTTDELAYHVGNIPATTFGKFYCDFLNDVSQLTLYVKLQRLGAILACKEETMAIRKTYEGHSAFAHTFPAKGSRPAQIHICLSQESHGGTVQVAVENRFGLHIDVTGFVEE